MDISARRGIVADMRSDHALLACNACRWWAAVSHKHECISKRGHKARDQSDNGMLAMIPSRVCAHKGMQALYDMSKTLPSNTTVATLFHSLTTAMFTNESWKLAVPALLYTLQNTLQYVAVSNLDAATFQVTYQLKILTTATLSVLMLGRSLSSRQWLSLLILIMGVSIVQLPGYSAETATMDSLRDPDSKVWPRSLQELRGFGGTAAARLTRRSGSYEGIKEDRGMVSPEMNSSVGLAAVLVACALSGLAGVSFEKILKESTSQNTSLWVRNCQLSFWSLFPALFLGVFWKDGEIIAKTGFFVGYNWVVWAAIICQAMGGVIVALVINYADNIAKNFATSISIIISCVVSVALFDFKVTRSVSATRSEPSWHCLHLHSSLLVRWSFCLPPICTPNRSRVTLEEL